MGKKIFWIIILSIQIVFAQSFAPLHDTIAVLTVRGVQERVLRHNKIPKRCGEALLATHSFAGMLHALPSLDDCNASQKSPENGAKTRALLEALRTWQIPNPLKTSPDTATQLAASVAALPAVGTLFDGKNPSDKMAFEQTLAAHIQQVLQIGDWAALTAVPTAPVVQPAPAAAIHADLPAEDSSAETDYTWLLALLGFVLAGVMGFLYWRERKKRNSASAAPVAPVAPPVVPPVTPPAEVREPLHQQLKKQMEPEKPVEEKIAKPIILQTKPTDNQPEIAEILPEETSATPPPPIAISPTILPEPIAMNIRYFSFPDGTGFSDSAGLDKFRPGVSVFELQINGNSATFSVADRPEAMFQALSDDLQYLNPVCTYANPFRADATRIATTTPGTAHLEGDQWVVSQKAVIQFV